MHVIRYCKLTRLWNVSRSYVFTRICQQYISMLSILSLLCIKRSQPAKCMTYGDPSTVKTSVFIAEILKSDCFFKRSLKKVLLYTEASKHRLVEQDISECPRCFFLVGRGGGGIGGAVFLPPTSLPPPLLSYPYAFLHPRFSLLSPSLLPPSHRRTLSKRLNDGLRGGREEGGVRVGKKGGRR